MRIALAWVAFALALGGAEVKTIAGNGKAGFGPDALANPYGLVVGPDGALYICEVDNHVVRRLDLKTRALSVAAGTGQKGYSGDGGPATAASLNQPYEVRFDRAGNMYFVEMQNHLVRRVDAKSRVISTVAGTGEPGFSGDGGPAAKAQLRQPHSIAFDRDGLLYIADIGNHRIRRVDVKTGRIETFAGTGERKPAPNGAKLEGTPLNGPRAIDFDSRGDMFLALREGNAVYRIDMQARTIHHIAGSGEKGYSGDGGPARDALLSGPKGISIAPDGGVFIADTESHTIRRIDLKKGTIETVAGTGSRADGPDGAPRGCGLARPHGVFVDRQGTVFIGDSENHRVRVLGRSQVDPLEGLWQGYDGEWGHVSRQLVALAEAIPAEKFAWRPAPGVRSTSEVFMHVALANFYLLSVTGPKMPAALKSADMEKTVIAKADVIDWLKRSLDAVKSAHAALKPADLQRKVKVNDRDATVDGMYLRIIVHANEHMGQLVAYARVNGIAPPWSGQ